MPVLPALSACRTPALAWRAVVLRDCAASLRLLENHECTRNAKFALRLIRNEQSRQMRDRGYADAEVHSQRRQLLDIIDGMVAAKPGTQLFAWRPTQSPGAFSCPSGSVIRANASPQVLAGSAEGFPKEFSEGFISRLEKISALNQPGQHVSAFDLFTYDWSTNARAAHQPPWQDDVLTVGQSATRCRHGSSSSSGTTISAPSLVEACSMSRPPHGLAALMGRAASDGRPPVVPPFPESDSEGNASMYGAQESLERSGSFEGLYIPKSTAALQSTLAGNDGGSASDLASLSKEQYENLLAQVLPQDRERVFAELKGFEQDLLKLFDNHLCFFGDGDRRTLEFLISSAERYRPNLHSMMEKVYGVSVREARDTIVQRCRDDNERIILDQQQICLEVKSRLLKELPAILIKQLTNLATFDTNAERLLNNLWTPYSKSLEDNNARGKLNGVQREVFKTLQTEASAILEKHRTSLANQRTAGDTGDNPAADPPA